MGKRTNFDTVLITIRGDDLPGITSRLTDVISRGKGVKIADIEQTVIHGKLLLSILLHFHNGSKERSPMLKELLFASKELGVHLDFEAFDGDATETEDLFDYVITCLGEEIGAAELSTIANALASRGINIDKIARLSHGNIRSIEMIAHARKSINPKRLSVGLLPLSSEIGVDIAIQKYDLMRQAKRLVVIDMDSTLIQSEVVNEMARKLGKIKKISKITSDAMNGRISFTESLINRVRLLKGLHQDKMNEIYKSLKLTDGAENFIRILKHLGYKTALISGGFTFFTEKLKDKFEFDYAYANELEMKDNKLTGRILGKVITGRKKMNLLKKIADKENISLDQTIAIGDGANDIEMLSRAGLGIAFRAKDIVRKKSACSISKHKGLDSILFLLGISEKELIKMNKNEISNK